MPLSLENTDCGLQQPKWSVSIRLKVESRTPQERREHPRLQVLPHTCTCQETEASTPSHWGPSLSYACNDNTSLLGFLGFGIY